MDDASHSHTQLSLARAALRVVPIPVCSYRSRPARLARLSPHAGEAPRCSLVQNGQFYLLNCTLMEASMSVPSRVSTSPFHDGAGSSTDRPAINERITQQTEANVEAYSADRRLIDVRLEELDGEWDIERILEANAAAVSLIGLTLARFVSRRWFLLPAAVAAFLLQHAVRGWCPPVPLFRRLGIRTRREIDERYALKAMRGDFSAANAGSSSAQDVLRAVRS